MLQSVKKVKKSRNFYLLRRNESYSIILWIAFAQIKYFFRLAKTSGQENREYDRGDPLR
jgi:hypothetical protein